MPLARLLVYAATAAVLAMTAFSLLVRPMPLGFATLSLTGYVALLLGGVFVIRWRVFVDAVIRGPPGARGVVLTFDDGPHPEWTPLVLRVLEKHHATATFFLVGRKAEAHPEVVRAILDGGHAIGLHSYRHDWLFAMRGARRVREDLERGIAVLEQLTGSRSVLFRPPIGHTNPTIARIADALDLVIVGWSIGGRDGWAGARPRDVAARVRRDLCDGAIVLLHDAPESGDREPAALRALPAILDAVAAAGLDVVPLKPWVERDQAEAAAGSTT
jgi:peptidoglycan/xylan/chitin deacetylase (PgdA/CDA1 family)